MIYSNSSDSWNFSLTKLWTHVTWFLQYGHNFQTRRFENCVFFMWQILFVFRLHIILCPSISFSVICFSCLICLRSVFFRAFRVVGDVSPGFGKRYIFCFYFFFFPPLCDLCLWFLSFLCVSGIFGAVAKFTRVSVYRTATQWSL